MGKPEANELPGLRDQAGLRRRAPGGIDRDVAVAQNDPALREYIARLRVSNCPGCKRIQWTPRGEPMMCPQCTGKRGTVEQASVPMGYGGRRQ